MAVVPGQARYVGAPRLGLFSVRGVDGVEDEEAHDEDKEDSKEEEEFGSEVLDSWLCRWIVVLKKRGFLGGDGEA